MQHLPRDIQLAIIQKFDMDTRIKTGLVFKIKVPENIKQHLAIRLCNEPCCSKVRGVFTEYTFYERKLGCRNDSEIYAMRFYESPAFDWELIHVEPHRVYYHVLTNDVWKKWIPIHHA